MFEFSVDEIQKLMSRPDNIRNISVVVDTPAQTHGLVELLVEQMGIRLPEVTDRVQHIHETDSKSIPKPLYARLSREDVSTDHSNEASTDGFLIHLMDCSEHASLSPDAACPALHTTDGVIVVLDCLTGISQRIEKVIQQALNSALRPVLFIDNIDRILLETGLSPEDVYQSFLATILSFNKIISQHFSDARRDWELSPCSGNVIFGSTCHGWAFGIRQFASRYARKFGVDEGKLTQRLWGDWLFDSAAKQWHRNGDHNQRTFNQFILEPIMKAYDKYSNGGREDLAALAAKLEVELTSSECEISQLDLLKTIMHKFLPAAEACMVPIVDCLPSPVVAQKYRIEYLYRGDLGSEISNNIRECNPTSDLTALVVNVIPAEDLDISYVIARVFSGTVRTGQKVRIQGENYIYGKKDNLFIKTIQSPVLLIGKTGVSLDAVPAGNFVCVVGLAEYIYKGGTITTSEVADSMRHLPRCLTSIVQCSVSVIEPKDLPKLVGGMKRLAKCDANIGISVTESGDHVLMGCSELHLKVRYDELESHYAGVPLTASAPFVGYRESVRQKSRMTALSKTSNRFSRLFVAAEPLDESLSRAIEEGKISPQDDLQNRARILNDMYGWNEMEARKIWTFGPDHTGPNLLVDMTKGVQFLNEIRDSFTSGFTWASREGPIAEEPMRSTRLNILDVTLFSDAIHRGGGQIIPAARRVTYAATLLADPVLCEPVYSIEMHAATDMVEQITSVLAQRRGKVWHQQDVPHMWTASSSVRAYLPVLESFGLHEALYEITGSRIVSSMCFDHWQPLEGSLWDATTLASKIALDLRRKKGLSEEVPDYSKFYDKL